MSLLDETDEVMMWDGGNPLHPQPPFNYILTFNIAGLTNEYYEHAYHRIAGRGANGNSENQLLKFDSKGKFLLQIGRRAMGNDSNNTERLGQPADMAVYPATNEVFVADGYGNRRVIVFDDALYGRVVHG